MLFPSGLRRLMRFNSSFRRQVNARDEEKISELH
jgi:hypothetical protein